jgi:hypothetical protein
MTDAERDKILEAHAALLNQQGNTARRNSSRDAAVLMVLQATVLALADTNPGFAAAFKRHLAERKEKDVAISLGEGLPSDLMEAKEDWLRRMLPTSLHP